MLDSVDARCRLRLIVPSLRYTYPYRSFNFQQLFFYDTFLSYAYFTSYRSSNYMSIRQSVMSHSIRYIINQNHAKQHKHTVVSRVSSSAVTDKPVTLHPVNHSENCIPHKLFIKLYGITYLKIKIKF